MVQSFEIFQPLRGLKCREDSLNSAEEFGVLRQPVEDGEIRVETLLEGS